MILIDSLYFWLYSWQEMWFKISYRKKWRFFFWFSRLFVNRYVAVAFWLAFPKGRIVLTTAMFSWDLLQGWWDYDTGRSRRQSFHVLRRHNVSFQRRRKWPKGLKQLGSLGKNLSSFCCVTSCWQAFFGNCRSATEFASHLQFRRGLFGRILGGHYWHSCVTFKRYLRRCWWHVRRAWCFGPSS